MRPSAVHGPFAGRTWLVTSVPLPPSRVNVLAGLRSFEARMATLVPEQRERRGRRRRPAPPPRVSSLRRMRGTQSEADLREARSRPDSPASAYSEDQARCSTIASIDRILSSMHSLLDAGGGPEAPLPPPALPETIPEEPDVPPQPPLRQLPQLDSQMSLDEMFTEIETLYDSLRNQNAKGGGGAAGSGDSGGAGASDVQVSDTGGVITTGRCYPNEIQCERFSEGCDATSGPRALAANPATEPYTSNITQDPIGAESRLDHSPASHRARSVPADVQRSQSLTAGSRSRRGATLSPQVCRQGGARRSASARTCRPPAPLPPPAAEVEVQYDVPRWPQPVPVHVRGPSAPAALPSRPVAGRRSPPEEVVYDTPRPVGGRPPLPLPLEPALPPRAATLPSPPLPPPPPPLLLETFSSLPGKQAAAVKPKPAIPVPRPPDLPPHVKTSEIASGNLVVPLPPKPPAPAPKNSGGSLKPCLPVAPMVNNPDVSKADVTVAQKSDVSEAEKTDVPEALTEDTPVTENQNIPSSSEPASSPPLASAAPTKPTVALESNPAVLLPASVPVTDLDNLPAPMGPPLPLPPKPAALVTKSQITTETTTKPTDRGSQGSESSPPAAEAGAAGPERTPSPPPVPQHSAPPDQVLPSASLPPKPELPASLLLKPEPAPVPLDSAPAPLATSSRKRPPLQRQRRVRSPSARSRRSPSPSQGTPPVPAHGGAPESPRPAVPRRLDSTARLLEGLTAPLPPPRPESPAGHLSAARRRAVALLLDDQLLLPAAPSHDPAHGPPARRTPRLGRSATAAAGSAAHGRRRRLDTPPSEGERERSPAAASRGTTPEQHSELCNGAPTAQQNCHDSDLDNPPTPPPRDAPPVATSSRGVSPSPNTTLNTTQDTIDSGSSLSPAPPISAVLETLTREAANNVPTSPAVQPPERPSPAEAGVVTPAEGEGDGKPPVSVSERAEKLRQQLAIRQPAADGAVHRSPGGSAREEERRHGDHCAVM